MISTKQIHLMHGLLGLVFITGCATPAYIHKNFDADQVGKVACLPVLDARRRPDPDHDFKYFGSQAAASMIPELKFRRGYQIVHTTAIGDISDYSAQVIEPSPGKYAEPGVIKQLGPPAAKWLMIPVCEDLNFWNALLVQGATAKLSLYLFNKETGELWWKGSGEASEQAGFLISYIAMATDKYALETDVLQMSSVKAGKSLPKPKNPAIKRGWDYAYNKGTLLSAPGVQKIAVTPTIDGRRRVSEKNPYQPKPFQDEVIEVLRDRGFDPVPVDGYGRESMLTKEQVAFGGTDLGKSLAGCGTRYVMVPVADEMGKFPRFGKHCEVSLYLFDTENGEVIWEGSSFGDTPTESIKALRKGFPKRKQLPQ